MRYLFMLLLVIGNGFLLAQNRVGEINHAEHYNYKLDYRVNYFDKMIFKVDVNTDIDNFYIPKLNYTNDRRSIFSPDEQLKLRFSFDYKFLGISYSFSPDFIPENNYKKADTKTLDLSFKFFYSDRLRQEVIFKQVKGFTLKNPDDLSPIDVFNDLQINTLGGKTFYIMNNNFSYRAYESQTERQLKSAGTFMPSLSYYLNNLYTNNPNHNIESLSRIRSFDLRFQFGYMYNYVINKTWFATGGLHPGIGINASKSYYENSGFTREENNPKVLHYNFDFNFSLGYNHENFFSGISANYKNYQYDNSKISDIMSTKFNALLFIGYRFNEVKGVKKVFETLEKKLHL
ncbi:DUF4421 family protein [Flavobacterium sp.]|uniref:DUF4421 family protein n=1 Tax=Flavobacterium sp. TaxID=239 RepID=UPI003D0A2C33